MSTRRSSLAFSVLAVMLMFGFGTLLSQIAIRDFVRESDFLRFHLANQLHTNQGLTYADQDETLLVLSPASTLLFSLVPSAKSDVAMWFGIIIHSLSAGLLFSLVRQQTHNIRQALLVTLIWTAGWPLWNGIRSEYVPAFMLVLLALKYRNRPYLAGLTSSLAVMFQLSGLIPIVLIRTTATPEVSRHDRKFLLSFVPLCALWLLYAVLNYDHILIPRFVETAVWQDYLWLLLFVISLLISIRKQSSNLFWILAIWVSFDLFLQTLWYGEFPPLLNPALPAVVAIALARIIGTSFLSKYNQLFGAAAVVSSYLLLIYAPSTDPHLQWDLNLAAQISIQPSTSIAHSHSDALTFALDINNGAKSIYRLDGKRSAILQDFVQRNDPTSALIYLAPDYVIIDGPTADDVQASLPGYELASQIDLIDAYQRQYQVGKFTPNSIDPIAYTSETQLTGIKLDQRYLLPGDSLRIRLDWQLERTPQLDLGIRVQFVDFSGSVAGASERTLPPVTWSPKAVSTYHLITLNKNLEPGTARLVVTLEYRAGILGTYPIGRVLIADPLANQHVPTPIDQIGPISLHDYRITADNGELHITTVWTTQQPINSDYAIFAHITPADSVSPLAQADGPPAQGRFPTDLWPVGKPFTDTRSIMVRDLSAGQYALRMGFYADTGERLRNADSDSITVGRISIDAAGHITVDTDSVAQD